MQNLNLIRRDGHRQPGHQNIEDPAEPLGNDYGENEIEEWYRDEERFHNQFEDGLPGKSWVIYRTFDQGYAFEKYFHPKPESRVLDFGCAEGSDIELLHAGHSFQLYGIDASETQLQRFRMRYPGSEIKKATQIGKIEYEEHFFDYIIVISTLHHIPNVSYVLSELARVLKPNGLMIIREPISYLRPVGQEPAKKGTSPHERGIPEGFMLKEFDKLGLELLQMRYSFSTPVMLVVARITALEKVSRLVLIADRFVSMLLSLNTRYYRASLLEKIAPGGAYFVVRKK